MKDQQHTPGPWFSEPQSKYVREDYTGGIVCLVYEDDGHPDLQLAEPMPFDANARLIAAAPDMLEALQYLVKVPSRLSGEQLAKAQFAINLATGVGATK